MSNGKIPAIHSIGKHGLRMKCIEQINAIYPPITGIEIYKSGAGVIYLHVEVSCRAGHRSIEQSPSNLPRRYVL